MTRLELQRKAAHAPGWAQLSALRRHAAGLQEDLTIANAAAAEQLSSKLLLQHAGVSEGTLHIFVLSTCWVLLHGYITSKSQFLVDKDSNNDSFCWKVLVSPL